MRLALATAAVLLLQAPATIRLQVRVFDGPNEVTSETRVALFRAGERQAMVAEMRGGRPIEIPVAPALYDAQAVRERDGRVVSIRWAERLVVMPYPDEQGRHLEIINFQADYGALQVTARAGLAPQAALFAVGDREKEAARPLAGNGYVLFVAPAGRYDLRIGGNSGVTWHPGIDVPRDRTRFLVS
jgi:hypothetical protein